jgi:hypothetical protein
MLGPLRGPGRVEEFRNHGNQPLGAIHERDRGAGRPPPEEEPRGGGRSGGAGRELVGVRPLRFLARQLVDEDGDAITDRFRVRKPQALLLAPVAEEALAGPQDDRENHQAQLVDEVVLDQRLHELGAAVDHDVPTRLLSQLRDVLHHVAPEYRRVVPLGLLEG